MLQPQAELRITAGLAGSQWDYLHSKALLCVTLQNLVPGSSNGSYSAWFSMVKSLQHLKKVEQNKFCSVHMLLHVKKGEGDQVFAGNGKNSILSDITSCILQN